MVIYLFAAWDILKDIPNLVSFVLLVVALVAAAYGGLNRETLKTTKESNEALKERVDLLKVDVLDLTTQLERERVARAADNEASNAKFAALSAENQTLRSVITAGEQLATIEHLVTEHHKEAKQWWENAGTDLHSAVESLAALAARTPPQEH